jgi:hypothetical protein
MSLKQIKLNGQGVLVQYQTDAAAKENIEIQKVFYHELDIAPVLGLDVLEQIADRIYRGEENEGV